MSLILYAFLERFDLFYSVTGSITALKKHFITQTNFNERKKIYACALIASNFFRGDWVKLAIFATVYSELSCLECFVVFSILLINYSFIEEMICINSLYLCTYPTWPDLVQGHFIVWGRERTNREHAWHHKNAWVRLHSLFLGRSLMYV